MPRPVTTVAFACFQVSSVANGESVGKVRTRALQPQRHFVHLLSQNAKRSILGQFLFNQLASSQAVAISGGTADVGKQIYPLIRYPPWPGIDVPALHAAYAMHCYQWLGHGVDLKLPYSFALLLICCPLQASLRGVWGSCTRLQASAIDT